MGTKCPSMVRRFVPHTCTECAYQITVFPEWQVSEKEYEGGSIYVSELTNHCECVGASLAEQDQACMEGADRRGGLGIGTHLRHR